MKNKGINTMTNRLTWGLVAAAILTMACSLPFDTPESEPKGSLTIELDGSRTIRPDFVSEIATWDLTLTHFYNAPSNEFFAGNSGNSATFNGLDSGTYDILIQAYNGSSQLVATGTTDTGHVTIEGPSTGPHTIYMDLLTGGTGTLELDMSWPIADVDDINVTVTPYPSGTASTLIDPTDYTANYGTGVMNLLTNLSSGFYFLEVEFSVGGTPYPNRFMELVHIYDHLTSTPLTNPIVMDSGDFTQAPNAPASVSHTVFGTSSAEVNWIDSSNNETGFKVFRVVDDGGGPTFTEIAPALPPGTTNYIDTGLLAEYDLFNIFLGDTISYQVMAYNIRGDSLPAISTASTFDGVMADLPLGATNDDLGPFSFAVGNSGVSAVPDREGTDPGARSFNGSVNLFYNGDDNVFDPFGAPNGWTANFWARFDNYANDQVLYDVDNGEFTLFYDSTTDALSVYLNTSEVITYDGDGAGFSVLYPAGSWHFYSLVYDPDFTGDELALYIDGSYDYSMASFMSMPVGSFASGILADQATGTWSFGSYANGSAGFQGDLDDLVVYGYPQMGSTLQLEMVAWSSWDNMAPTSGSDFSIANIQEYRGQQLSGFTYGGPGGITAYLIEVEETSGPTLVGTYVVENPDAITYVDMEPAFNHDVRIYAIDQQGNQGLQTISGLFALDAIGSEGVYLQFNAGALTTDTAAAVPFSAFPSGDPTATSRPLTFMGVSPYGPMTTEAAATLSGTSGLSGAYSADLSFGFTFSGWIGEQPDLMTGFHPIIGQQELGDYDIGWFLQLQSGVLQLVQDGSSSGASNFDLTGEPVYRWNHLVVIVDFDNNTKQVFWNDVDLGVNPITQSYSQPATGIMHVASKDGGLDFFLSAQIDDFRLWPFPLDPVDVPTLYSDKGFTLPLPVDDFDGAEATTANDGSVDVTWNSPAGASEVYIEITPPDVPARTVAANFGIETVTGLTNGVTYDFDITARNNLWEKNTTVTLTDTPVDTTPPAPVTGMAVNPIYRGFTIDYFTPSDADLDFIRVEVLNNVMAVIDSVDLPGAVPATPYQYKYPATGFLDPTVQYAFRLIAFDSSSNDSSPEQVGLQNPLDVLTGAVNKWNFDLANPNEFDDSSTLGTNISLVPINSAAATIIDRNGTRSYPFDGSRHFNRPGDFPMIANEFTIVGWVGNLPYNPGASGSESLFSTYATADHGFTMDIFQDNIRFSNGNLSAGTYQIPASDWLRWNMVTLMVDRNAGTFEIYWNDGTTPVVSGSAHYLIDTTEPLFIGARPNGFGALSPLATMDDIRIFDTTLEPSDITDLWNEFAAPDYTPPAPPVDLRFEVDNDRYLFTWAPPPAEVVAIDLITNGVSADPYLDPNAFPFQYMQTGLIPDTEYVVEVVYLDDNWNRSAPVTHNFRTLPDQAASNLVGQWLTANQGTSPDLAMDESGSTGGPFDMLPVDAPVFVNDRIEVGNRALDSSAGSFTINSDSNPQFRLSTGEEIVLSFWFKAPFETGPASLGSLLSNNTGGALGTHVQIDNSGIFYVVNAGTTRSLDLVGEGFDENLWHHAVIAFKPVSGSDREVRVYLDGDTSSPYILNFTNWQDYVYQNFEIGRRPSVGNFQGELDDFRFYRSPLSDQEIQSLYNSKIHIP